MLYKNKWMLFKDYLPIFVICVSILFIAYPFKTIFKYYKPKHGQFFLFTLVSAWLISLLGATIRSLASNGILPSNCVVIVDLCCCCILYQLLLLD